MKTEEQIKMRRSLAECKYNDIKGENMRRYHQGWMDALDWVIEKKVEELNAEMRVLQKKN